MARPREWIPSEKELNSKVKMVEVQVTGLALVYLDEKRRASRPYTAKVLVPENYTPAHIKYLTPDKLRETMPEFWGMRTFKVVGKPAATKETRILKELYTEGQLKRFAKKRLKRNEAERRARKMYQDAHGSMEGYNYDPDTDMPRFADSGDIEALRGSREDEAE